MLWKLDGLSEYDARRPMTPTGTNLLAGARHVRRVRLPRRLLRAPVRPQTPLAWRRRAQQ
ncbi:DUF664 domain-containing protein [Microlunatus aurantiacus]|uniref:mycothiol transferase n=1 Tax=Microlunatus aurantiacus TaxID=446786 RepID=UPI0031E36CFC